MPVHDADTHLAEAVAALATATGRADEALQRVREVERRVAELTAEEAAARRGPRRARGRAASRARCRHVCASSRRWRRSCAPSWRPPPTRDPPPRTPPRRTERTRVTPRHRGRRGRRGRGRVAPERSKRPTGRVSTAWAPSWPSVPPAADVEQALATAERLVVEQRAAVAELHDAELDPPGRRGSPRRRSPAAAASARTGLAATTGRAGPARPSPAARRTGRRGVVGPRGVVGRPLRRVDDRASRCTSAATTRRPSGALPPTPRCAPPRPPCWPDADDGARRAARPADARRGGGVEGGRRVRRSASAATAAPAGQGRCAGRRAPGRRRAGPAAAGRRVRGLADGGCARRAGRRGPPTRLLELSSGQFSLERRRARVHGPRPRQRRRAARRPHAVGRRDVPRLAVAGPGAGRRDRRSCPPRARRRSSRSSSTRASARSTRRRSTSSPTTIEELGSAGRMVGVVTHIRELADRMPVRFEVTKRRRHVDRRARSRCDAVQRRDVGAGVRLGGGGRPGGRLRRVDATVEQALADWAPVVPTPARADRSGCSSSTACGASTPGSGSTTVTVPTPGVCASVAAGIVECVGLVSGRDRGADPPGPDRPGVAPPPRSCDTRHGRLRGRAPRPATTPPRCTWPSTTG